MSNRLTSFPDVGWTGVYQPTDNGPILPCELVSEHRGGAVIWLTLDEQYHYLKDPNGLREEVKCWEPSGGEYFVSHFGGIHTSQSLTHWDDPIRRTKFFGLERATVQQAENLLKFLSPVLTLKAWVDENGRPGNYYLIQEDGEWRIHTAFGWSPGRVTMSRETAQRARDLLLSGELVLESRDEED